jgi:methyltransferase (TIGR00027 family)
MTMSPVGTIARWIAAARALETECADPLFSDPFARELAGDAGFSLMATMRQLLGATGLGVPDPCLSIRTRYLDDELMSVTREQHLDQVVLLAAGMDTRAFRFDWPSGVVLFGLNPGSVAAEFLVVSQPGTAGDREPAPAI